MRGPGIERLRDRSRGQETSQGDKVQTSWTRGRPKGQEARNWVKTRNREAGQGSRGGVSSQGPWSILSQH